MACGIYKITNLLNNKCYIGQSCDIKRRWKEHKKPSNDSIISKAIHKYGVENFSFEIIEECEQELLSEREIFYIEKFNSYEEGYNLTIGGEGKRAAYNKKMVDLWNEGYLTGEIANLMGFSRICVANNLTAAGITPEERLKRTREVHLPRMREKQKEKYPNGEWRSKGGNGRPRTKDKEIREYLIENPSATKSEIKRDLGISYPTIRKYYDEIKKELKI